jgi:tetratricopeptide (TPR) repeat protein
MRKLLFIVGLTFTVSTLFAQKVDDVKKDVSSGKYTDARAKIDQMLNDPKNASNSDVQFYKAVVYHNLAKQNPADTTLGTAALDAMRKYLQMEESKPEGQRMLLSTLEGNKTLVDLYTNYFNKGVENFKNSNYPTAFNNFEKALDAFDILSKAKLTNSKFDTTVTLYAGYSAQNSKMYDKAAKYYDMLINNNINDTSYIGIYRFMINNNLEKKDTATAKKYLDISRQRFPAYNDLWLDYQTLFLPADKPRRFDEYETLVKANPKNEGLAMNYAAELYSYIRSNENAMKDSALLTRAENAFKNLLTLDPNSISGNLLLSQLYWTEYYSLQDKVDAIRGNFPEAVKKKKELNSQIDALFERTYPYLTKVSDLYAQQTNLKPQDKANYRIVLGQLVQYYQRKKQTDKATATQQKLDALK